MTFQLNILNFICILSEHEMWIIQRVKTEYCKTAVSSGAFHDEGPVVLIYLS